MSKTLNMVGGGGGGLYASIFATGVSQSDTVTLTTPSGKVKSGKWTTKEKRIPYAIPAMTSNTTPSGKVSVSSSSDTSNTFHAFDGDSSTYWLSAANAKANESYIQYEFPNAVSINSFTVKAFGGYASGYASYNFNWVMQGSNDGNSWENITEEKNTGTASSASAAQTYTVNCLTDKLFQYIRFQITSSSTGYAHVANCYSANIIEIQVDATYPVEVEGFLFDKLGEYGTYTVAATRATDGKTITENVEVSAVELYTVELTYARLPVEYQEVEYIESSGTQYIDTGAYDQYGVILDATMLFTAWLSNTDMSIAGTNNYYNGQYYRQSVYVTNADKYWFLGCGNSYNTSSVKASLNTKYHVYCDNRNGSQTLKIDETDILTNTQTINIPSGSYKNIYVFCVNTSNALDRPSAMRLFSLTIYNHLGEIMRDFVPCYEKATGAGGLYDLVTKTFYMNNGSGDFVIGADVAA